jgi:predicted ATP-dependent serine protease
MIRTANKRNEDAKNQPDILKLLGGIWQLFELCLLFADTGIGKSIAAIQIADCLSKGVSFIKWLINENEPLTVLYYDFELSDRQFFKRYSNEQGEAYKFSEKFYIDNVDFTKLYVDNPGKSFTEILFQKIRIDVELLKIQVLIIDNITFLHTQTTQDQQASLEIMRFLIELKKEFNLSILVLAHTPKKSENQPITISDLSGSKHLSNFADSVFCIGKSSKATNARYIKQIKPSRSSEMEFDIHNVVELQLEKKYDFLGFQHSGFASEFENLNLAAENDDPKLLAISLKNSHPELSLQQIADKVGKPKSTVKYWLDTNTKKNHVGEIK